MSSGRSLHTKWNENLKKKKEYDYVHATIGEKERERELRRGKKKAIFPNKINYSPVQKVSE